MEQLLYHYTDFTSLDGIINRRELRVNNVLNMNDSREMDLFISGLFDAVKKRFEQIGDEKMASSLDEVQRIVKNHYFDLSAYAACFSESRDDAAQWERYANRGKGVCLCFRKAMLEKLTGTAISLTKVTYQNDMDDHPLAEKLFELLKSRTYLRDAMELKKIVVEVCRNSAAYKHPSFASESEYRLVVMPSDVKSLQLKTLAHTGFSNGTKSIVVANSNRNNNAVVILLFLMIIFFPSFRIPFIRQRSLQMMRSPKTRFIKSIVL